MVRSRFNYTLFFKEFFLLLNFSNYKPIYFYIDFAKYFYIIKLDFFFLLSFLNLFIKRKPRYNFYKLYKFIFLKKFFFTDKRIYNIIRF